MESASPPTIAGSAHARLESGPQASQDGFFFFTGTSHQLICCHSNLRRLARQLYVGLCLGSLLKAKCDEKRLFSLLRVFFLFSFFFFFQKKSINARLKAFKVPLVYHIFADFRNLPCCFLTQKLMGSWSVVRNSQSDLDSGFSGHQTTSKSNTSVFMESSVKQKHFEIHEQGQEQDSGFRVRPIPTVCMSRFPPLRVVVLRNPSFI